MVNSWQDSMMAFQRCEKRSCTTAQLVVSICAMAAATNLTICSLQLPFEVQRQGIQHIQVQRRGGRQSLNGRGAWPLFRILQLRYNAAHYPCGAKFLLLCYSQLPPDWARMQ